MLRFRFSSTPQLQYYQGDHRDWVRSTRPGYSKEQFESARLGTIYLLEYQGRYGQVYQRLGDIFLSRNGLLVVPLDNLMEEIVLIEIFHAHKESHLDPRWQRQNSADCPHMVLR